ncbi:4416_t:CDS:2 [Acaulospora morrowiae]|uniref:4416_t:CDS:1 n=1 Tax=Acaulospora morrowiae TaxID=94023 RepID=A0A9N8WB69_9GLOM|nr:4416_t:CDS:2 [Acaulospora morrowiae]
MNQKKPRRLVIDIQFYEQPEIASKLEPIREKLSREIFQRHAELSNVTSKELALFLGHFQKVQEEALGRFANRTDSPPPKIPAKLFKLDPAPAIGSAIYHIIRTAYSFRGSKKWRRWDWENMSRKDLLEMVTQIRNALEAKGLVKKHIIIIRSRSDDTIKRQQMISLVNGLGGQMTQDATKATHIVQVTNEMDDADEEWYRTLEKKNGKVFLHWWYYPDSYDAWVDDVEHAEPEPIPNHIGPWNVTDRWLRDSAKFNEWMNEEDYEITDNPDNRRTSAEDQSVVSETDASLSHKRSLDALDSHTNMDVDARPNIGAKRARLKSPDFDHKPVHPNLSIVDIEQESLNVGGTRAKKNELDPVAGGEIANISQLIPPEIVHNEEEDSDVNPALEDDSGAIDDNVDVDSMTSDMKEIRIPADNNSKAVYMDLDANEQEQNRTTGGHSSSTNRADTSAVTPKKTEDDEHMLTSDDIRHSEDGANEPLAESANTQEMLGTNDEEEKKRLEEDARKYLSQQTQEIIIPSYAAWFNIAKIHPIEQKSLPEFFNNKNKSKNPTTYKEYRDFMINTYRLNPGEYLTVTACRRNLAGDVCAIIRIHAFLEQWGLINYQIDPETRPSLIGPPFTGHFRVMADTPRGLQPFQPNGPSMVISKPDKLASIRQSVYQSAGTPGSQDENGSMVADSGSADHKQYHCFTCGVDCTRVRYHSLKTQNFELCPNCYLEGRYPTTMYSGDFLKMDDTPLKHSQDEDWTEQELLLLFEGIELFEDDWNKISDHVGTRTREQCILQFLEFPIEDPLNGSRMSDLGPLQYQRIPFSQADNPVMSVVAFLASVVNPGVAAAAAKSALKQLEETKKSTHKDVKDTNGVNSGENAETAVSTPMADVKHEDEMDVESAIETKQELPESSLTSDSVVTRSRLLERAGATAMGSAAAKAKVLADYEEREIQRLVNAVIENQLKKLELKLQQFEELESALENEKKELEKQRQLLYIERLNFKKSNFLMQDQLKNFQAGSSSKPLSSGQTYTTPVNTRIIPSTEYHQQQQRQSVGPLSQDEAVLMNI